jgi:hypothetical protein
MMLSWTLPTCWAAAFFSLNAIDGTSLFLPSTIPASNQPVVTSVTCRAYLTSTRGPQLIEPATPTAAATAANRRAWEGARMTRDSRSELPDLHTFSCLFQRQRPGLERREIASLDADDERGGIVVFGR